MSHAECIHAERAEAFEDHRLSRTEEEAFASHVETCPRCERELADLRALADAMRSAFEHEEPDAEHVARSRASVLRRRAEERRDGNSGRRHAPWMFAAAVVAITAFSAERAYVRASGGAASSPPLSESAPAASVVVSPVFEIEDVEGAVVHSGVDRGLARSTLSRGVASFHVQSLAPGQRFLLELPDGELEVRGTRFVVSVQNGSTRRVDVSEGAVVVRLRGEPERVIRAGERWAAPSEPVASSPPIAPSTAPPSAAPAPSRAVATRPAPTSEVGAPGPRFVDASRAFQSGSYARADVLLVAFLRDFPDDPRAEDAAFLRVMAHEKMGDHTAASKLAQDYLRAYPNGLRRREAERLAAPGD